MIIGAPPATASPPQTAISFKRVLLLCVPALIIGLVLRVEFLTTIPEVYYGSDSNTYFDAAWRFWHHGKLTFNVKTRFFYPIVLIFMPLLPGSTAVGTAVVQHLLGLVILVGIGWVVAQMTRLPNLWVPLVTCAAAVWPRTLWYEHEMIAEVWLLGAFVTAAALAVPCGSLKDPRRLFWFLIATAVIVACKPHGRPLWLGLMVVAVAMAGNPLKWKKKSLAVVASSVLIILTSGSGQQGSWLFLSSTLPFVKTEGEPYAEYRAILRPIVKQVRADLGNYAVRPRYKKILSGARPGLGNEWLALTKDRKLYKKVANRLAFEAVIAHPLEYAHLVLRKIALASGSMPPGRIAPAEFWRSQESANADRLKQPKNQLQMIYGMPTDEYLRLVEDRRKRTTWLAPAMRKLASTLGWTDYRSGALGVDPEIKLKWLGWLLTLGLVTCLAPRHFVCRALLWLPVVLYLFAVFSVGDAVRRYLQPVEWVGLVIIAMGLDSMAHFFVDGISRLRRWRMALSPNGINPSQ